MPVANYLASRPVGKVMEDTIEGGVAAAQAAFAASVRGANGRIDYAALAGAGNQAARDAAAIAYEDAAADAIRATVAGAPAVDEHQRAQYLLMAGIKPGQASAYLDANAGTNTIREGELRLAIQDTDTYKLASRTIGADVAAGHLHEADLPDVIAHLGLAGRINPARLTLEKAKALMNYNFVNGGLEDRVLRQLDLM